MKKSPYLNSSDQSPQVDPINRNLRNTFLEAAALVFTNTKHMENTGIRALFIGSAVAMLAGQPAVMAGMAGGWALLTLHEVGSVRNQLKEIRKFSEARYD